MGRQQRLELQVSGGHPSPPSPKPRSPVLEKISALARGHRSHGTGLSQTSSSSLRSVTSISVSPTSSAGGSLDSTYQQPIPSSLDFIEAGGRGQMDAPRGASNGGDRRVTVRCRGAALNLVVGLETTAAEILMAVSERTAQPLNLNTSILTESCAQLGIERRLRRYERIRDILNSWDQDSQNTLVVCPDLAMPSLDLELGSVAHTGKPPSGFILHLYHSQKPGKWSKRYIALLEGGQVLLSKKYEPGPSDRDSVSLCHLSDCDIYVPTDARKRKHLKPPKKYCYAVKSQQKAAIFENTANYIHYFCTDDPDVGQEFFDRIHAWRSWYTVNRVLHLFDRKKVVSENPSQIPAERPLPPKNTIGHVKVSGHKLEVSVNDSPNTIGALDPLINSRRFDKPLVEFGKDWVPDPRPTNPPPATTAPIKLPIHREGKKDSSASISERGQGAFAEGGLLGAAYDRRKKAQREESLDVKLSDKPSARPFVEGPSLLNSQKVMAPSCPSSPVSIATAASTDHNRHPRPEPSSWFPSALEHSAKARQPVYRPTTSSTSAPPREYSQHERNHHEQPQSHLPRWPPQPLIDLTPKFVEPPQWNPSRAGRGYRPPAQGKPLVDFATGPPREPTMRNFEPPPPQSLIRRASVKSSTSNSTTGRQPRPMLSTGDLTRRPSTRPPPRSDRPPITRVGRPPVGYEQGSGSSQYGSSSVNERDGRDRTFTTSSTGSMSGRVRTAPSGSSMNPSDTIDSRYGRGRSGTMA